jgi:hypothetical protein
MASALDYIISVNASSSQISHVKPMTVQDVYALVTLIKPQETSRNEWVSGFGKSTGVFSHKRARSTRIRRGASNIKRRRKEKGPTIKRRRLA